MGRLPALRPEKNACESPHLVLLGAGTSRAACLKGDANGRTLPLMLDLVEETGVDKLLSAARVSWTKENNFETLYQSLVDDESKAPLVRDIEEQLHDYFCQIEIPEAANLYDRLLLSLRAKDYVATFNWDPLLAQAYKRNRHLKELPEILFLHGNVEVGVCLRDQRKGFLGSSCTTCDRPLERTRLLYPVARKDYTSDPFISQEWAAFRHVLQYAYLFTIIGYAAPASDIEAVSAMRTAWSLNESRELAEIEIVDVKERSILEATWAPFFVRNHYGVYNTPSPLFRHARRSCDHFAMASLQNNPCHDTPLPQTDVLNDLQSWASGMIAEEVALREHGTPLPC